MTIQTLIDALTDETQISVEERSLPILFNSDRTSLATDLTKVEILDVGFTRSGLCLIKERAKHPNNLEDITRVLCISTRRDAKPVPGDADADTDTANHPG